MKEPVRSLRVLIVDDSPEDRYAYRRLLNSQPRYAFTFIESETGEDGLLACEEQRPDCVLLDYRLPDLDGVEFLTRLRTNVDFELPVIVLTRQGDEEIAVRAMRAGAQDYLLKDSVSGESLSRAIEFVIEKAANRRERELRKQAEDANRIKDEFLATLSHEMRTPLNAILGWITLIRSGRLAPERVMPALEAVERNARIQTRLVEDLLDVSRIISGTFVLDLANLELENVLDAAIEVIQPAAEAKGIQLSLHKSGAIHLVGDAARLQQAIWNLLSNAVKFTPQNGTINVRLDQDAEWANISVSDNGVGIAPEFLPYVFDRFRQADGSTTRSYAGLGLGLAIARHIAELHGGVVRASSEGLGRGATFSIRIPARLSDADANPIDEERRSAD